MLFRSVERGRTARDPSPRRASSARRRVHLGGLYALEAPERPESPCRRAHDRLASRSWLSAPEKVHPARRQRRRGPLRDGCGARARAAAGWAEFPGPTLRIHPFASMRFHVLLNSLFKVLFNFPSRYLSAIGLVPVFSLRWSLPPALGCIPKQPDSEAARRRRVPSHHGPDTRSG